MRHRLPILLAVLALALASCGSDGSRGAGETREPPRTDTGRISPLGLDQPDPERLFQSALAAFEARDAGAFLSHFAFINQEGRYFVASPGESDDPATTDLERMQPWAAGLKSFISSDYARVTYAPGRNVRNTPPTVEIPITIVYDFSHLTAARKRQILAEFNQVLALEGKPPMTWEQYERQVSNLPRRASRRFVYVDGGWRFDAGWRSASN